MAIAPFRWHVLLYCVLTPLVLPASNASAFFFNPSLNFINPADGILTGNTNGSASLDVAPRWDSVDRNDGVGTNHSLVGGLTYNFDNGGTVAGYFADFTFSDGTTAAQFTAAVTAALNAWSSAAPITFTKTNTAVVLNDDVTKNQVGGNEIDFFGRIIPSLGRTGIVGVDQRVRLTNGFSTGGGTFPSTRIYS